MACRRATHAGSWYKSDAKGLDKQLSQWMAAVPTPAKSSKTRAIIAPHAGYSYSGPTAAHAYKCLETVKHEINTVFVLGPSHHYYCELCELSACGTYATPFGDLALDHEILAELGKTGQYSRMATNVDEDEHSIELHLPYIAYAMRGQAFKVVPVLVGNLDAKAEDAVAKTLAPYFSRQNCFFVISSDFCHWGSRFRYTRYNPEDGEIWESIEKMDRLGVAVIQTLDHGKWWQYQDKFSNTICGRHPIGVLLQIIHHSKADAKVELLHYEQSSKCVNSEQSSVSYVSASISLKE